MNPVNQQHLSVKTQVAKPIAIDRQQPKSKPALRLIDTKTLNREQWLDVRRTGVGASDAAAAVGLNPYKSQLELWMEKTGRDANLPKPNPDDTTEPVYWGTLLEPIVAASYTKQTGNKVRRVNAVLQHPNYPWMLANLDREVIANPNVQILECKTTGINGFKLWVDGVPEYIQLQVQHQLAVTGKQVADVAVLVCGQRLDVYRIHRDDALIARLIELEVRFWQYVETDTEPPADGSKSADTALRALYPHSVSKTIDFTEDRDLSSTFADLVLTNQDIKARQKIADKLKQTLIQAMGDAEAAKFETGYISFKQGKDTTQLDTNALAKNHPDLVLQYQKLKLGIRRFLTRSN